MGLMPSRRGLCIKSPAAWIAPMLLVLLQGSPALSGWREDMKTFRIGMVSVGGAGQSVPGLSSLKRAYAQALGMPVEVFVARDYAALIDAQATQRIDYAIYSATAYGAASLLCSCVEPVVAPLGSDGATGITAILVTRDGRLASFADIGTHRVAIAPPQGVATSMLPLAALSAENVMTEAMQAGFVSAGSAAAAEAMLVDGSVDAMFGWAGSPGEGSGGTLARLAAAGLDPASLKVVWQSPLLRYGPHALRTGLDGEIRRALLAFLTGLRDLQPDVYELLDTDHGGGFVEVQPRDYATALDMVRHAADGTVSP